MARTRPDMIKGTLDMLVLKVLALEPMHGWGICERIQQVSRAALRVNQGSLYASLQKLTRKGCITSSWRTTEHNRRARYYQLTPRGERRLARETAHWRQLSTAVTRVLAIT